MRGSAPLTTTAVIRPNRRKEVGTKVVIGCRRTTAMTRSVGKRYLRASAGTLSASVRLADGIPARRPEPEPRCHPAGTAAAGGQTASVRYTRDRSTLVRFALVRFALVRSA